MEANILVTGIGGNVGQGVLRNLRSISYYGRIIGTDIEKVSGGNHLCDLVYQVPYAYDKSYIDVICDICEKNDVGLIIPTTDYEVSFLTDSRSKFPALPCSDFRINEIFFDKYITYKEFIKHSIPFARSILPSQYKNNFSELIVKPRKGRGSRNIFFNPPDVKVFSDDYVIQELYKGQELTTAFYVDRENEFLSQISFIRELNSGTTSKCCVTFDYDSKIEEMIQKILLQYRIIGPCNIQSIIVNEKTIIPFEINSRISGTNSIRAQFGFQDVKYIVDEYVYNKQPEKPIIIKGSAIRILMDVIYPEIDVENINNIKTDHYIF